MAMLFESVLKGRIVEAQLTALLEQAGYSVRKMGVEALVEPVKRLSLEEYRRLEVPLPLRKMPDLLVMTSDHSRLYMVEVKYRRVFDAEAASDLVRLLRDQRAAWSNAYVAILLGTPILPGGRFHQDHIRVLPLAELGRLLAPHLRAVTDEPLRMRMLWESLPRLQDVFRYFYQSDDNRKRGGQGQQDADLMARFLRKLAA
jgi:hypothetical protein